MEGAYLELRAENLCYRAGERQLLQNISLSVRSGEAIGLWGASGAGKTTLLLALAGMLRPSAGRLALFGQEPWTLGTAARQRQRARALLAPQVPPLPPRQRVVTAVLAGRLGQWPLWKALASLLMPMDPEGAARELARLDLADRLYERCDRLSGGQQQRVALARVLYQQPELLLADEPVSAMDPALSELTVALLNEEAVRRGVTLVASLHAVDLALRHFPRVVGVKEGAIVFDLPAAAVSEAMLRDLYAAEGVLPVTHEPADAPAPGLPPLRCA